MSFCRLAISLVIGVAGVVIVAGCRDREPESRFIADLGEEEGERLLPVAVSFPGAYDPAVMQGRAKIVERDDVEAIAEAATATATGTVAVQPASTPGEAVKSVLGAFFGNMVASGGSAAPGDTSAAGTGAERGAADAAVGAGGLAAEDAQAIQEFISGYSESYTTKNFLELASYCVQRQRAVAGELFGLLEDIMSTLEAFLAVYEKTAPELVQEARAQIQQKLSPVSVSNLAPAGENAATGTLQQGGGEAQVQFERDGRTWRIVHPGVPSDEAWPERRDSLEDLRDEMGSLYDSVLDGETVDQSRVRDLLDRVLALMTAG